MNDESPNSAARSILTPATGHGSQAAASGYDGRAVSGNDELPPVAAVKPLPVRGGRTPPIILDKASPAGPPILAAAKTQPASGTDAGPAAPPAPTIGRAPVVRDPRPVESTRAASPVVASALVDQNRSRVGDDLTGAVRSEEEELIAPFVDFQYYRATYEDVLASNIDPVVHYARHGWKERRNPSRTFNTGFYLDTNPDVAGVDVNPLWHYVVTGRDEGRRAIKPADIGQRILRDLVDLEQRSKAYVSPDEVALLDTSTLRRLLSEQASRTAFVISISHDDYTRAVGGTQVFIADEQAKFAADDTAYLHLSPLIARLRLATGDDGVTVLRLILNGQLVGFADAAELTEAIAAVMPRLPVQRVLICHCLMGHRPEEIIALHQMLRPQRSVYWLHDYSSICPSVTLLRNDVTFCGAPPPQSNACRICVYGRDRAEHVERCKTLFSAVAFDVVAPSQSALDLWMSVANLPARSTHVHPHAEIRFTSRRRSLVPIPRRGTASYPVRVAFAGHPVTHKGWPAFSALIDECEKLGQFEFYHFWTEAGPATDQRVKGVAVTVTGDARDDMIRALSANSIDLVLVLSTWPETFSFVTYEAMSAGADVVTFADSGNVAAEVLRSGRGLVMKDFPALLDFFVSGSAIRYVRLCYEQGNPAGELLYGGTSATLLPTLPVRDLPPHEESVQGGSVESPTKARLRGGSAVRG